MAAASNVAVGTVAEQAPAHSALAVVLDDEGLDVACRALWVGTGGDLTVKFAGGDDVVFANVPDGTLLPIAVSHVMEATTASDIVALY